jgi:hypothetical protein
VALPGVASTSAENATELSIPADNAHNHTLLLIILMTPAFSTCWPVDGRVATFPGHRRPELPRIGAGRVQNW